MAKIELLPFCKIATIDGNLHLDWLAGIYPNTSTEADNPIIDCYFSPVKKNPSNKKKEKLEPDHTKQVRAAISVGYLPALHIGQIFNKGDHVPIDEQKYYETITFELDTDNPESQHECNLADLNLAPYFHMISYDYFRFAAKTGVKKLHGKLLSSSKPQISNLLTKKELDINLFINEMELIRFYLVNTEFSCRNLFSGAFTGDNYKTQVVNNYDTDFIRPSENNGQGRLVYKHEYGKKDALTLGRIIFDPAALKAAQRVSNTIVTDRINLSNGSLGYPRTYFPFTGKTKLQVIGKRLRQRDGEYIFHIYKILSCTGPFPFKYLSYCNAVGPGGLEAKDNTQHIDFAPKNEKKTEESNHGQSVNNQPPSKYAPNIDVNAVPRTFHGLNDIIYEYVKTKDCTHKSNNKKPPIDINTIDGSTGKPTAGDSNTAQQKISSNIYKPSKITADLRMFKNVISNIQAIKSDWKIKMICIGNVDPDDLAYSFFPEVPCRVRRNIMRQFSFIDKEKTIMRRFICVEISVYNQYLYLFEAQRKYTTDENQPDCVIYKDKMPILLLKRPGLHQCDPYDFIPIIEMTVIKETWPAQNELDSFLRDYTVHGRGALSAIELAQRVINLIERNLSQKYEM